MKYMIISHERCGWLSPPMDQKALEAFGVPWYCGNCGMRITKFVCGTLDEVNEWEQAQTALKEGE